MCAWGSQRLCVHCVCTHPLCVLGCVCLLLMGIAWMRVWGSERLCVHCVCTHPYCVLGSICLLLCWCAHTRCVFAAMLAHTHTYTHTHTCTHTCIQLLQRGLSEQKLKTCSFMHLKGNYSHTNSLNWTQLASYRFLLHELPEHVLRYRYVALRTK